MSPQHEFDDVEPAQIGESGRPGCEAGTDIHDEGSPSTGSWLARTVMTTAGPTLDKLDAFAPLPVRVTVRLDAGYDSKVTRDLLEARELHGEIAHKIDAYVDLADTIITLRSLIRQAWTLYRWDNRPARRP